MALPIPATVGEAIARARESLTAQAKLKAAMAKVAAELRPGAVPAAPQPGQAP